MGKTMQIKGLRVNPYKTVTEGRDLHLSRRQLLKAMIRLGLLAASVSAYAYLENAWMEVTEIALTIPGLSDTLAGKRIVQLSDLHLSQFFTPEHLFAAIRITNQLAPDWLVLTGDYASPIAENAAGLVEPLRQVEAPVFASFGNHDHWTNVDTVRRYLQETPAIILQNEAVALADGLWLAGIDDVWLGKPDLRVTLRAVPAGATTLLLAHEPDFFDTVIAANAPVAVQLSGHSHGGQIRLPRARPDVRGLYSFAPYLVQFARKYPIGLYQRNHRQVYTNRGIGSWPLPCRINCRPEISLFTLYPANA